MISVDAEQVQEARLKPNFGLHLDEVNIDFSRVFLAESLFVNKVAPLSIHAVTFCEVDTTFFSFIF